MRPGRRHLLSIDLISIPCSWLQIGSQGPWWGPDPHLPGLGACFRSGTFGKDVGLAEGRSPHLQLSAQSPAAVSSLRLEMLDRRCLPAAGRVSGLCVHTCLLVSSEDRRQAQARGSSPPPTCPSRVFGALWREACSLGEKKFSFQFLILQLHSFSLVSALWLLGKETQ